MSTEGREQLSEEFYDTRQKIMDKVNKNHYIMLTVEMHARVESDEVTNIWVRNNNNGKSAIGVSIFNNLKITNIFLRHKDIQKITREGRGHKSITECFITN